jgi:hypothetical protein
VKKGTPTDTIYHELNRGSIVSKIMDRQYAFKHKLDQVSEEEALVKCFWNRSQQLSIVQYYNSLDNSNYVRNKTVRAQSLSPVRKRKTSVTANLLASIKPMFCIAHTSTTRAELSLPDGDYQTLI